MQKQLWICFSSAVLAVVFWASRFIEPHVTGPYSTAGESEIVIGLVDCALILVESPPGHQGLIV
jgi:hypothetical protein